MAINVDIGFLKYKHIGYLGYNVTSETAKGDYRHFLSVFVCVCEWVVMCVYSVLFKQLNGTRVTDHKVISDFKLFTVDRRRRAMKRTLHYIPKSEIEH